MATSLSIDESPGVQNNGSGESENNELAFGAGVLPAEFTAALAVAAAGQPNPQIALSGYTTTTTAGANFVAFGAPVTDVGFTDSAGAALDGDFSGLRTIDGTRVFLYTWSGDNNVLLGLKGNDGGTPGNPADDTADPNGDVVFAAYLDTQTAAAGDVGATGARVWLAQYEPLVHPNATDPDDTVSPDNVIYVNAATVSTFSLEGAPSGQNLFLMFGDGSPASGEKAIVVTGRAPASGDTVNTGQGGGGTTIGSNNQMLDPGEGLYFSFVTITGTDNVVPNLDQTEADDAASIDFTAYHSSTGAKFSVVQLQPPKEATLTITAINNQNNDGANEVGTNYVAGLGDADDAQVDITQVIVSIPVKQGKVVTIENHTFNGSGTQAGVTATFTDGVVTLAGVEAGYGIAYTTAGGHNRVLIENSGNTVANLNSALDIGGFSLVDSTAAASLLPAMQFDDDGPAAAGAAVASSVDEDGLPTGTKDSATGDLAVPNGDNDNNEATNSGVVSGIFSGGRDGLAASAFSLSGDAAAIAALPSLTSKGGTVAYAVSGNVLTAFVNVGGGTGYDAGTDRAVFTLALTNAATGAFTFTLLDQLDHPTLNGASGDNTENDLVLNLGSVVQATDKDGDSVRAAPEKLAITVDDDMPLALNPSGLAVHNNAGATASAALGSFGRVGADEAATAVFTGGTNGNALQGVVQDGSPGAAENLTLNGLPIYLFGYGTSTLVATTNANDPTVTADRVFEMTLSPDGSVQANDIYDIEMFQKIANTIDIPFGSFTAHVASGNPLTLVVNDIGGSPIDALFSGFLGTAANAAQTTVNVSQAGVGVGTGQDFDFNGGVSDRIRIEFLQDDGDGALEAGEAQIVNRFTYVMNQNNSPADDGDLVVRTYNGATEVQITGILVNGQVLVGAGGAPRASNDGTTITAVANGLGYDLHGLGGGNAGDGDDNDTVTIITGAPGYTRIDIAGTGADANKDTFDILLQSVAIPTSFDITFSTQAQMADFDADLSAAATLNVTLDSDGVLPTLLGLPQEAA